MVKLRKIFILEDDVFTSRIMKSYFEEKGFIVIQSFDIGSAFFKSSQDRFDAAIIDINIPSGSSLDYLSKLKKLLNCPIIICTSRNEEVAELKSFQVKADDFVNKDRGLDILLVRLLRLLDERPANLIDSNDNVSVGNVLLNKNTNIVTFNNDQVLLSSNETKVLLHLIFNNNQVVFKDELYMVLYGVTYDHSSRSLDIIISRLRKKIRNNGIPLLIETVHGKGHILRV